MSSRPVSYLSCLLALVSLAGISLAPAQTSPSFKLEEHVFNAGGHPESGQIMTSASFRITLDALGESVVGPGLSSPSYRMDGSFGSAYPPPGEVRNLRFTDDVTLEWDPETSVGVYNLYLDLLSGLSGLGYGQCEQYDLTTERAHLPDDPPNADGYFYLVTAENRLGEEGTKGADSSGGPRPNPDPCP
jgi:hypothetical protein